VVAHLKRWRQPVSAGDGEKTKGQRKAPSGTSSRMADLKRQRV